MTSNQQHDTRNLNGISLCGGARNASLTNLLLRGTRGPSPPSSASCCLPSSFAISARSFSIRSRSSFFCFSLSIFSRPSRIHAGSVRLFTASGVKCKVKKSSPHFESFCSVSSAKHAQARTHNLYYACHWPYICTIHVCIHNEDMK